MKEVKINLYMIDELNELAKEQVIQWYREREFEIPFLGEQLEEFIKEELDQVDFDGEIENVQFDLSYSQGSGVMFAGNFIYKRFGKYDKINIYIKHSGHYYHYNSKTIDLEDEDGDSINDLETEEHINDIYVDICKRAEKYGYSMIEDYYKDESIINDLRDNEYWFTESGEVWRY